MENLNDNNKLNKVYKIKSITRLCSNGRTGKLEFRITEIKSLMRFWWRALNSFKECDEILQMEGKIFGTKGNYLNNNIYKSPVTVKLIKNNFEDYTCNHIVGYNKKFKKENSIKCFESGGVIDIQLNIKKRRISKNEYSDKGIEFYDSLLKISLILGGIGKRSRRGCGVFKIEDETLKGDFKDEMKQYMECLKVNTYYNFDETKDDIIKIYRKGECRNDLRYPYIEEILISLKSIEENNFYRRIKNAIDSAREKGYKYSKKKSACPVYVTCYGDKDKLYPIIIKLHNNDLCESYKKYYETFKNEVILCQEE